MSALLGAAASDVWPLLVAAGGLLLAMLYARHSGRSAERRDQQARDADRAREIEERADEALRRNDGDTRPADEQLRDSGWLRD